MKTETEFRAEHEARVVEKMAEALMKIDLTASSYKNTACIALEAYQSAMWLPMSEAPKDVHVLVGTDNAHGLPAFTTIVKFHPDGSWCVDELRESIACQPLPLPPEETP